MQQGNQKHIQNSILPCQTRFDWLQLNKLGYDFQEQKVKKGE